MLNTERFETICDKLRLIFSRPSMLLLVPVILVLWRLVLQSSADPDLFARVALGRLVEKFGGVLLHDPFSFTEKLPLWIDHEWLSGVIFHYIGTLWGDQGLLILKLLVAVWTCLLSARASEIYAPQAAGRLFFISVCLLEASFIWMSTVRCQIFTYFIISFTYFAFAHYRVNRVYRYLLLIPPACIGLVNMHGGYALEILVLWCLTTASIVGGKSWKILAAVSVSSSVAPVFSPYGFRSFVSYLLHAITMDRPNITEWYALYRFPEPFIHSSLIATLLLLGVMLEGRRKSWNLAAILCLSFSFYCGFAHFRFVGFAMLTAVVFGPTYFGNVLEAARSNLRSWMLMMERSLALVCTGLLTVMFAQIIYAASRRDTWHLNVDTYPVKAIEMLRNSGATGKLLVDFNVGSFALWYLYPRFQVSLDGRYEAVYTNQTVEDVSAAFSPNTPQGLAALRKIAPTHILFHAAYISEEIRAALPSPWREIYRDDQSVVYATTDLPSRPETPSSLNSHQWNPLF